MSVLNLPLKFFVCSDLCKKKTINMSSQSPLFLVCIFILYTPLRCSLIQVRSLFSIFSSVIFIYFFFIT